MARLLMACAATVVAGLAPLATPLLAASPESAQAQWVTLGTAGGPRLHANQAQFANAVLVGHFVPAAEDQSDVNGYTAGVAASFKGPVRLARDLDRF